MTQTIDPTTAEALELIRCDERFWAKVEKTEFCWLWRGWVMPNGYGRVKRDGRNYPVHRFAYEQVYGAIPEGLQLDHLCRTRHCVRFDHLEAVSQTTNILRGTGFSARNARKTHCAKGHPFDLLNTQSVALGRRCGLCHRDQERARRKRRSLQ